MMHAAPRDTGWGDVGRHPLMLPLAALIVGILVARWFDIRLGCWFAVTCTALLLWLMAQRRPAGTAAVGFWLLLIGWAAVGGTAVQLKWRLFRADDLGLSATTTAQPIHVIACAASAPQTQAATDPWSMHDTPTTRLLIRIQRVRDGRQWRDATGLVVLRVAAKVPSPIFPGDKLEIWGHLSRPARPNNPGEPDRAARDRADRVLCHLEVSMAECLRITDRGAALRPWRLVEQVRGHARRLCERYIASEQVPLATALLLGTREQLDRHVTLAFLETGTIHILAISGLHLGMLVWMVWLLARTGWLSRRAALWMAVLLVGPYAVLTGGQPPVVRAAALAICLSGGRLLSRPAQGWNLLAASALTVLCFQPLGVFQTGVQLSFLAVATLGHCENLGAAPVLHDPLDRLLARSQPRWKQTARGTARQMMRIWGTSLFVSLITLPLIVHRFHVASPISVFLNPLLWAPIALALCTGFGVLLLGDLLPPAAAICGWTCGMSLEWAERGIFFSNEINMGHCWMPAPATWMVIIFYIGVGAWSAFPRLRPNTWMATGLLAGWFGLWLLQLLIQQALLKCDSHLRFTFFSVGHGTCVLVEMPHGETVLYDAGRMGSPYTVSNCVAHEIWARGRFTINTLVISHADADHFNAVGPLIERIHVSRMMSAPHVTRSPSPLLQQLRDVLAKQELALEPLHDRSHFPANTPARVRVLHPPPAELRGSDNANSVVLVIEYAGRRILLPGDLEEAGLARLLSRPPLHCDVVMAPHHGSIHSRPADMMGWARPKVLILSSKSRAPPEWRRVGREHGTEILDTYSHHAIRCEISKEGEMSWRYWNDGRWMKPRFHSSLPPGNPKQFGT